MCFVERSLGRSDAVAWRQGPAWCTGCTAESPGHVLVGLCLRASLVYRRVTLRGHFKKTPTLQIFKNTELEVLMVHDHLVEPCLQKLAEYRREEVRVAPGGCCQDRRKTEGHAQALHRLVEGEAQRSDQTLEVFENDWLYRARLDGGRCGPAFSILSRVVRRVGTALDCQVLGVREFMVCAEKLPTAHVEESICNKSRLEG